MSALQLFDVPATTSAPVEPETRYRPEKDNGSAYGFGYAAGYASFDIRGGTGDFHRPILAGWCHYTPDHDPEGRPLWLEGYADGVADARRVHNVGMVMLTGVERDHRCFDGRIEPQVTIRVLADRSVYHVWVKRQWGLLFGRLPYALEWEKEAPNV